MWTLNPARRRRPKNRRTGIANLTVRGRVSTGLWLGLGLCLMTLVGRGEGPKLPAYERPAFTIAMAEDAPLVDGYIDETEWQDAFSTVLPLDGEGNLCRRQVRVWWCWDADNLYFAMRSDVPAGTELATTSTDRVYDTDLSRDDRFEIWLGDGHGHAVNFAANSAGAHSDSWVTMATGAADASYESAWRPSSRISAERGWEVEMTIPRRSLQLEAAFADGQALAVRVVRHFAGSGRQASLEGGTSVAASSFGEMRLGKETPALQVCGLVDPAGDTIGLVFSIYGRASGLLKWEIQNHEGSMIGGQFAYRRYRVQGSTRNFGPNLALDAPGEGRWHIAISDTLGQSLFAWQGSRALAAP